MKIAQLAPAMSYKLFRKTILSIGGDVSINDEYSVYGPGWSYNCREITDENGRKIYKDDAPVSFFWRCSLGGKKALYAGRTGIVFELKDAKPNYGGRLYKVFFRASQAETRLTQTQKQEQVTA